MNRLAYEIVAIGVDFLTNRLADSHSLEEKFTYTEQCTQYIESCGWSTSEFENETLRRIDAAWDEDEEESSLRTIRKTSNS